MTDGDSTLSKSRREERREQHDGGFQHPFVGGVFAAKLKSRPRVPCLLFSPLLFSCALLLQVGVEDITDIIETFEDYVQSVDMTTSE